MPDFATLVSLPFVQRALLGGLLVAVLTSWMGILVVLKQSSFFGDAIAHASLMGVALGLLLGFNPIAAAAFYAMFVSFLLPFLKRQSRLPTDSLLGFLLPFSMGIGVILLSLIPGYQPELISFLFGSILSISWHDVLIISTLVLVTFFLMSLLKDELIFASFDSEYAKVSGVKVEKIDVLYHILLSLTVVAGIKLVGIILINALLVIPASTVRLFANSLKEMFIATPLLAIVVTIFGLSLSFILNVPSGPTITSVSGGIFIISLLARKLIR